MDKTAALSTAKEELAHSKHELGMTKKQLSADEAFLVELGDRCANADKEYAERTKMRQAESNRPPQPSDHVLAQLKAGETMYQAGELPKTVRASKSHRIASHRSPFCPVSM